MDNVTPLHRRPRDVSCPVCDAAPRQPCRIDVGYLGRRYHLRRIDKIR